MRTPKDPTARPVPKERPRMRCLRQIASVTKRRRRGSIVAPKAGCIPAATVKLHGLERKKEKKVGKRKKKKKMVTTTTEHKK
jgi:hypothetical protein